MFLFALLSVLAGIALALGLVRLARGRGPVAAARIYAAGLLVAAALYLVFALAGQADARWVLIEIAGVLLYGTIAWLGVRRWLVVLAIGWAGHVLWDVALHMDRAGAAFAPSWYPWLCIGFDLVLAGSVVALRFRRHVPPPNQSLQPRPGLNDGAI
jgi:hypothetical protein